MFFSKIAINHKMSIFSKGHDAKKFLGKKYCSTGKKASENPESGWVYRRWYTYCILNKCDTVGILRENRPLFIYGEFGIFWTFIGQNASKYMEDL